MDFLYREIRQRFARLRSTHNELGDHARRSHACASPWAFLASLHFCKAEAK
jgi:hypothetical protein